jgi:hypothetical protein
MGVRPAPDNYFVRLGTVPAEPAPPAPGARPHSESHAPRRRRRRRRGSGRTKGLLLCALVLGAWTAWAVQQPGGVSGTINGWIDHVRGDVQDVASGRDLKTAAAYYDDQYARDGRYPLLSDEQLTAAGISIDINVVSCGGEAVVLQTITVSRLLVAGKDHGEVGGRVGCPGNLDDPKPWK